jgi:hypothetical protein
MVQLELQRGCVESHPGPNNGKKKNGNGTKKRPKKNNDFSSQSGYGTRWTTVKGYGPPDFVRTPLRFIVPLAQLTGGGTTNSFKFSSNAYDVDTALASTAIAGFSELAYIYSRFRTLGMKYSFDLENQEAFPAQFIHGFTPTSLGATSVGANYAGNRYMHQGLLSPVNGSHSTRRLSGSVSIAALFGDKGAFTDDLYTGSTTSSSLSSSRTAYLYIGTVAASTPVNGQFVCGWIELDLIFDKRNALIV